MSAEEGHRLRFICGPNEFFIDFTSEAAARDAFVQMLESVRSRLPPEMREKLDEALRKGDMKAVIVNERNVS